MSDIFWANDLTILIDKNHIMEVWPSSSMHYTSKLNAITRLTIILTGLGYLAQPSTRILMVGISTIIIILLIHMYYKKTGYKIMEDTNKKAVEGFALKPSTIIDNPEVLKKELAKTFSPTTPENPLSNVLLTDIQDNPNKLPAPPSFLPEVYGNINSATKKMVQNVNKDQPDIDEKLFGTLGENYDFDTSMRQFSSTANTRIVNDQGAFAQFLYGNMPSCKDGDVMKCSSSDARITPYR
jgi:hypothetical protein